MERLSLVCAGSPKCERPVAEKSITQSSMLMPQPFGWGLEKMCIAGFSVISDPGDESQSFRRVNQRNYGKSGEVLIDMRNILLRSNSHKVKVRTSNAMCFRYKRHKCTALPLTPPVASFTPGHEPQHTAASQIPKKLQTRVQTLNSSNT